LIPRRCPQCGEVFVGMLTKKYCSRKCQQIHNYDLYKERRKQSFDKESEE